MNKKRSTPDEKRCQTCTNSKCPRYSHRFRNGMILGLVDGRFALFMTPAAFTAEMGCTKHIGGKR